MYYLGYYDGISYHRWLTVYAQSISAGLLQSDDDDTSLIFRTQNNAGLPLQRVLLDAGLASCYWRFFVPVIFNGYNLQEVRYVESDTGIYLRTVDAGGTQQTRLYIPSAAAAVDISSYCDIVPQADITYSLGDAALRWANIYSQYFIGTSRSPAGGAFSIQTRNAAAAYIDRLLIQGEADDVDTLFKTDLFPNDDDTYDLGDGTHEWKDLRVDGLAYIDGFGESWGGKVTGVFKDKNGAADAGDFAFDPAAGAGMEGFVYDYSNGRLYFYGNGGVHYIAVDV